MLAAQVTCGTPNLLQRITPGAQCPTRYRLTSSTMHSFLASALQVWARFVQPWRQLPAVCAQALTPHYSGTTLDAQVCLPSCALALLKVTAGAWPQPFPVLAGTLHGRHKGDLAALL